MTTYKVSELEGALLNAAVAMAEGAPQNLAKWMDSEPSERWDHGGPIIERERIDLMDVGGGEWAAVHAALNVAREAGRGAMYGPTALIAAMRAYVASVFGETVEML
jgi:hypothetical protein